MACPPGALCWFLWLWPMFYLQSPHPLPRGVKAVGEPRCQSPNGSLSLLDGELVVFGAVWPLLCGPHIPHQQACGHFVNKQMMQIPKRLLRHVLLVFKPLPRSVLKWALCRWSCKTGVSCSFLIHRYPEHFGRELKRIFFSFIFHSLILAECQPWLDGRGRTRNWKRMWLPSTAMSVKWQLWNIKALYSEHTTLLGLNSKPAKHKERLLFCSVCLGESFWYLHGCYSLVPTAGEEE